MTCRELTELVTEYLEGALDANDRARLEAHLDHCEGCRAYVGQMRATIWSLSHVRDRTVAPAAKDALLDTFRDWNLGRS